MLYLLGPVHTRTKWNGSERNGTIWNCSRKQRNFCMCSHDTRTTRNVPFRSEKWTALKSEPYNGTERNGTERFSPRVNTFLGRSVPLCGFFSCKLISYT